LQNLQDVFFLQTNGSGVLSFSSPSSDFVLLATTDASSSASVSFDGYFSSTYKNYIVIGSNVIPASDGQYLGLRYRRSNADITSSNYRHIINIAFFNNSDSSGNSNNGARLNNNILITSDGLDNTTTNGGSSFNLTLYNPLNTNTYKFCTYQSGQFETIAGQWYTNTGTGMLTDNTSALSGLTFYITSGNIATGTFKLYGIK
jgi:hypothetical protein